MTNISTRNHNVSREYTGEDIKGEKPVIPKNTVFFFSLFLINTVVPLFDLPVIGLSLTAPLMLIIAVRVIMKPAFPWFNQYKRWWFFAGVIWICWLVTAVLNSFLGRLDVFSTSQVLYFFRIAYWLIVMVITTYVVSQKLHGDVLVRILNSGVFILGLIRLGEAVIYGRIGAGTSRIFSQNAYGILFSSFAIFPLIALIKEKGSKKIFQFFNVAIVYLSIIFNSSRSSWISLSIGFLLMVFFLLIARRLKVFSVITIIFVVLFLYLIGLILIPNPEAVIDPDSPILERFRTFTALEEDTSVGTRQYLIRRGIAQFKTSPILGIGIERGRFLLMEVEIPESVENMRALPTSPLNEHNSYIQILAETGLLGSIPYAIFLIYLSISGFKSVVYLAKRDQVWAVAVFCSFVSMSAHLFAITALRNTAAWVVYGMLGGMIMVAENHRKSQGVERAE